MPDHQDVHTTKDSPDSTVFSTSSSPPSGPSWFTATVTKLSRCEEVCWLTNYLPSSSSRVGAAATGDLKTTKIRLFPTRAQRRILNSWFGTARWTYNRILAWMKEHGVSFDAEQLRARFINKPAYEGTPFEWVIDTPYDVRDAALTELLLVT